MEIRPRTQDFLEWAKEKSPDDVLSHSSVDLPDIDDKVRHAYRSDEFRTLLKENNQWGLLSLRQAISKRYSHAEEAEENPRVLLTPGASSALYLVCKTFVEKAGDQIVIESPDYEPLSNAARLAGADVVYWPRTAEGLSLDIDTLEEFITDRTRLILFSNPHNPSGDLTSDADLQHIADIARPRGIKVVVDEIFGDIAKNDGDSDQNNPSQSAKERADSAVQLGDEFISINSLSKVYGLSRIRSGWILGTPDVIQRLRIIFKVMINIGALDTEAVSAILFRDLDNYLTSAQNVVRTNRGVMRKELTDVIEKDIVAGKIPDHGCTYFPKLGSKFDGLDDLTISNYLKALDKKFSVAPGAYFGGQYQKHFRIGLGGRQTKFRDAIRELREALEELAMRGDS